MQHTDVVCRPGRKGMNAGEIATTLGRPEADIMETLRMLGLPLPGERASVPAHTLSDEERAALRSRMPKRWQDRQGD